MLIIMFTIMLIIMVVVFIILIIIMMFILICTIHWFALTSWCCVLTVRSRDVIESWQRLIDWKRRWRRPRQSCRTLLKMLCEHGSTRSFLVAKIARASSWSCCNCFRTYYLRSWLWRRYVLKELCLRLMHSLRSLCVFLCVYSSHCSYDVMSVVRLRSAICELFDLFIRISWVVSEGDMTDMYVAIMMCILWPQPLQISRPRCARKEHLYGFLRSMTKSEMPSQDLINCCWIEYDKIMLVQLFSIPL